MIDTRTDLLSIDCLQASKDIQTFEEAEFSGVKLLTDETLLRMMEMMKITHENRARILKLEKRFHQRSVASALLKGAVILD